MAKVSRSMLKSIVKECLVELLAEGLSEGNTDTLNEHINKNNSKRMHEFKSEKSSAKPARINPNFEKKTQQIISQATNDPIMASILEDTAQTTLQEQNTADRPNQFTAKPTDTYSQIASDSDPMSMFGEASNNWASLAFSNK